MFKLARLAGGALVVALAIAVGAPFLRWVYGDGRGLCPANVPAGVPAGLTWADSDWGRDDADICITTDTSVVRRVYHWPRTFNPKLAWSPDGEVLAIGRLDDPPLLVTVSGEVKSRDESVPSWYPDREAGVPCGDECSWLSPDGKSRAVIRVHGFPGRPPGLYLGPSAPGGHVRWVRGDAKAPTWSPDSQWVAFVAPAPPKGLTSYPDGVFVVRSDGTSLAQVAGLATSPVWRPIGD